MSENTDRDRTDEADTPGLTERAAKATDKNLHVHPDEATGDIDPFDEERTTQTSHGLSQKDKKTR